MKKNHLWFILALSCLVSSCDSALTFDVQCNKDNKDDSFCYNNKIYKCTQNDNDSEYSWKDSGKECIETTVVTCNEGETKCSGGNIFTCDADGNWGETPTTECGELGCSEGTIQPASMPLQCYACGSDESKCEGDKLKTCVNHTWVENTCEYGCNADQCNECKPNETKCEDGYIYTCTDGKWDETGKNKCEFGCINGLRADDGSVSCNECQENDMSCNGDAQPATIKKCMGNRWRDFEICEFGCAKADDNNYQCNDCNKDDYSNNPQNFCIKKVCTNHKYEKEETFEVSCNEERTDKGECLNGSAQCVDSGNGNGNGTFQFCLNGKWNNFGSCDSNNECSSLNGKTCADFNSVGYTCNDQKLKACPNNASCKSDGSGCATCTNGATKCEDGNILECKNGEYQTTACGTGKHCEVLNGKAKCVAHICENGQQKCENNAIYECQNYQWKLKSACTGNDKCIENNNTASCGCTSGNAYCDGSTAKTCVNGKWKNTSCSNGKICTVNANEAKCVDCTAGQTKCSEDNKSIRSCTNGGSWAAANSCSDGMTCTGNDGNATCVCTDGQAKCDGSDKTKIYKCKDGKYGAAETCDGKKQCKGVAGSAVCANDTECESGTKQCDGNKLKTCKPNGKWESQTCEKGCKKEENRCFSPVVQCNYINNKLNSITFDYNSKTYSMCINNSKCKEISFFCSTCEKPTQICHSNISLISQNSSISSSPKAFTFSCQKDSFFSVSTQCQNNHCDDTQCDGTDDITPIIPSEENS